MKLLNPIFIIVCVIMLAPGKAKGQDFGGITQGVDTINGCCALGSITLLSPTAMPIVVGNSSLVYCAATFYEKGRAMVIGHNGALDDRNHKYDQLTFLVNSIKWLNPVKKSVLIKNGYVYEGIMLVLISALKSQNYTVTATNDKISAVNLSNYGVVIFGNDWNGSTSYSSSEINSVDNFVKNGGGVFIAGLGWSYPNDMSTYAMNNLAGLFGFNIEKTAIPDAPFLTKIYPKTQNYTVPGALKTLFEITSRYPSNLPYILQNDSSVRVQFSEANLLLYSATLNLPGNSSLRDSIFAGYKKLFLTYPALFQNNRKYDKTTETSIIWNRARMFKNFVDAKDLTVGIIQEIGNALGFTDVYLEIWNRHQVLLLDNYSLDSKQLKFTKDLLSQIPGELIRKLSGITFSDFLGSTYWLDMGGRYGTCNTFSNPIGINLQNQFPNDITPGVTSVFCGAMAHEVNHIVNAYYIWTNDRLTNRQNQLITQIGTVSNNYLRANFYNPPSQISIAPQEFFASLSNQWFTDSKKVFDLAILRFNKNYHEPINTFLFYADVYSLGTDSTVFYFTDTDGNITSKKIPVTRDNSGNINSIKVDNKKYTFVLNDQGNVMSFIMDITVQETKTFFVSNAEFEAISPKIFFEGSRSFKTQTGADSTVNSYFKFVYNPIFCTDTIFKTVTDTTFVSVTDTLFIDVTLTGSNSHQRNTIKIYPNPAHDFVIVDTGNYSIMPNYKISILNIGGQQVYYSLTNSPTLKIDVKNFGGYGTYIVQIRNSSDKVLDSRKLVLY